MNQTLFVMQKQRTSFPADKKAKRLKYGYDDQQAKKDDTMILSYEPPQDIPGS